MSKQKGPSWFEGLKSVWIPQRYLQSVGSEFKHWLVNPFVFFQILCGYSGLIGQLPIGAAFNPS